MLKFVFPQRPFPWLAALLAVVVLSGVGSLRTLTADDEKKPAESSPTAENEKPADDSDPKPAEEPKAEEPKHVEEPKADEGEEPKHAEEPKKAGADHSDPEHGDEHHSKSAAELEEDLKHETHDLGGANATATQGSLEAFSTELAIYTLAVFLLLAALLGAFAWKPIVAGLDAREKSIQGKIDEAEQRTEQAARKLAEYEDRLSRAAEEAEDILAQAKKDAQAASDRILTEARESAERERDLAKSEIETAKNAALQEVTRQGAEMAVSLAGQILSRELNSQDHTNLIANAVNQFPGNN